MIRSVAAKGGPGLDLHYQVGVAGFRIDTDVKWPGISCAPIASSGPAAIPAETANAVFRRILPPRETPSMAPRSHRGSRAAGWLAVSK